MGRSRLLQWKGWLVASLVIFTLLISGCWLLAKRSSEPREAPEAERVLSAQTSLPFQVLIPAYLPGRFDRERMQIETGQPGPQGEAMIQLIYPLRDGNTLVLSEWIPNKTGQGGAAAKTLQCMCMCQSQSQCTMLGAGLSIGPVRLNVMLSAPNLLTYEQMRLVLDTLGPAANRQVYSNEAKVPLSLSVPPAVDIPTNSEGFQEVTLIVTPQGYNPPHFAVKKGIPVRLIFRQLGQVGCGNELIIQWGRGKSATLLLASANDQQVLEFTPAQSGEFRFNCPHLIYRGVMTVKD